jgi:hypothetical protein
MVSTTKLDFPEPDTPVTQVMVPSGMSTSMPRRLLARAPRTPIVQPFPRRRWRGTGTSSAPAR